MNFLFPDNRLTILAGDMLSLRALYIAPLVDISSRSSLLFNQSDYSYSDQFNNNTSENIDFDFGEAVTVDYIFLGRIDWTLNRSASTVTVTIEADDNSSFTSPETDSFTLNRGDQLDKDNFHYASNLTFTTDYRYYRVNFSSATAGVLKLKNIWLGQKFNMGRAEQPARVSYYDNDFDRMQRGNYTFNFRGVTTTDKVAFENNIDKYKEIGNIAIFDSANDYFLSDKLFYGYLTKVTYKPNNTDLYDITIEVADGL